MSQSSLRGAITSENVGPVSATLRVTIGGALPRTTRVTLFRDSAISADELMKRGFTVRTGDIWGLKTHIRVSYGTMEQNRRFIQALKEILA